MSELWRELSNWCLIGAVLSFIALIYFNRPKGKYNAIRNKYPLLSRRILGTRR
jgi:hypothetical protein